MFKKLLLIPLMGVISFGAFASADTVDGFTSDSVIGSYSFSDSESVYMSDISDGANGNIMSNGFYFCLLSNDYPFNINFSDGYGFELSDYTFNSSVYCSSSSVVFSDNDFYFSKAVSGKFYVSASPLTYSSSSDSDSSLGIPSIPESFTSGLTSLVNNFGSTIVNWLPTIILVALGIYAIFALFRVVRNYARSSFNG